MQRKYAIRNIITGLLLTVISVWLTTTDLVFGSVAAIFFGTITLLVLVRVFKSGHAGNDTSKNGDNPGSLLPQDENGIFSYTDQGFTLLIQRTEHTVPWTQVKSMVAYKMDRFASDDISMDVFCDGKINFSISEETPGWATFLDKSKLALPIDKFWEIEMATPGLEINLAVVYDRQNRTYKEIQKEYYNS